MQSSLRAPTYLMTPVFDPLNLSQIERDPVAARVCECVAAGRLVISRVTCCHASSRRTGSLNTVLVSSNNSETAFVTHVFSANYCAEKYCCGSTQYQQQQKQQQQKRRSRSAGAEETPGTAREGALLLAPAATPAHVTRSSNPGHATMHIF